MSNSRNLVVGIQREKTLAELAEQMKTFREREEAARFQEQLHWHQAMVARQTRTDEFNEIFRRWGLPALSNVPSGDYGPILQNLEALSKRMEELQEIATAKIITE